MYQVNDSSAASQNCRSSFVEILQHYSKNRNTETRQRLHLFAFVAVIAFFGILSIFLYAAYRGEMPSPLKTTTITPKTSSKRPNPMKITDMKKCKTIGGNRPTENCVFPFRYQGVDYNSCTTKDGDFVNGRYVPWCATRVGPTGEYMEGKVGKCGPKCHQVGGEIDQSVKIY